MHIAGQMGMCSLPQRETQVEDKCNPGTELITDFKRQIKATSKRINNNRETAGRSQESGLSPAAAHVFYYFSSVHPLQEM